MEIAYFHAQWVKYISSLINSQKLAYLIFYIPFQY
jgi:hypothetical protein